MIALTMLPSLTDVLEPTLMPGNDDEGNGEGPPKPGGLPAAGERAGVALHRVLIVDDDDDALFETRETLEAAGYEVYTARHGRDALQYLTGNDLTPGLVLLDLNMPVMSGWELLAVMRSYARLRSVPVVLMTSRDVNRVSKPAFQDYLKKPFDADELLEAVARFCPPPPRTH